MTISTLTGQIKSNQYNPYDELEYYSKPFSYTSIALLEGNATFWGLKPPALKGAKVLELGSSFGGSLISQAVYYPDTEFVGVDLADSQITQGNEIIQSMGLTNVRLETKNILEICRENLTSNGIAYISYNTYPGWKSREVARDIMLYANKYTQDLPLAEQTRRGKVVVQLFSDAIKSIASEKIKNHSLVDNFDSIQIHSEHYIAHEYLAYHNHPIYLHQFVDSLNQHQLAYIGDTSFQLSYISWMPHHLREMIDQLSETDYVAREQCLDYLYDVVFRRSLLCHQHCKAI